MGRAKEDQPESSSLEGCCCGPLFHKESRGISQVSQWNVKGLSEVRWMRYDEKATDDGHMFDYSGREDKHEHGARFLVHKGTINLEMGFHLINSSICTLPLRASPFTVTIVQVYAPALDYDDSSYSSAFNVMTVLNRQAGGC